MRPTRFLTLLPLTLALAASRTVWGSPAPVPLGNPPSPGPQLVPDSQTFMLVNKPLSLGTTTDVRPVHLTNASAAGASYLWDVDVTVTIAHPAGQALDLKLIAPGGRTVTLSTGNGGTLSNAYAGTLFDDSAPVDVTAPNALASTQYVAPEGALSSLQGLVVSPGQNWTLQIDKSGNQPGMLVDWKLDIATLVASSLPRYGPTSQFITTPHAIPNDGVHPLTDHAIGGNMGTFLAEAQVFVKLIHDRPSQLEIQLLGPNGYIPLSLHNGGSTNDNAFNGTLFFDAARESEALDSPVTDAHFSGGNAEPNLVPEGALASLIGTDPNSGYSLRIFDTVGDNKAGTLLEWGITCWTYDQPSQAGSCIAGHSAHPCTPNLIFTGGANGYFHATGVDNNRTALVFYGVNGPFVTQWGPFSKLCVKSPLQRTAIVNSGGPPPPTPPFPAGCDGVVDVSWADHLSANPYAIGNQVASGTLISAQLWWRDPQGGVKTSQLSNMVQFLAP